MSPELAADGNEKAGRFATTRWSLILRYGEGSAEEANAREALAELCRIYWRPIFAYLWRKTSSPEDAKDLTQEFCLRIIQGKFLRQADPGRGRFRSLLLHSVQNFLRDRHDRDNSQKRGGEMTFISWDQWMAEAPSQLSVPASVVETWSPERVFDVRWAATVAERALRRLQEECEGQGRRHVFDVLGCALTSERDQISYERMGRELGADSVKIKRLLHKLRLRYRKLLREEVAETVEKAEDIDEELRYLVASLAIGRADGVEPT
jgi:RNA polymerase sigma-70 factor (ECF subfamily)